MKAMWQLDKVPIDIYTQHPIDAQISISCLQRSL